MIGTVQFGPGIEDTLHVYISFLRFQTKRISTEVNYFFFSVNINIH